MTLLEIAHTIFACPTAPFHESQPLNAVVQLLSDLPHLKLQLDRYGNLSAHYKYRPSLPQHLMLVGHLDHPGFEVAGKRLRFLGGVDERFFVGKRIAYFRENDPDPIGTGVIEKTRWTPSEKQVWASKIPRGAAFAMWDLPSFQKKGDRIEGRNCDDFVAVVTMVALLRELAESNARTEVTALFTRAEEVGFYGSLAVVHSLPKDPHRMVLSLEASNAKGFATWNGGVIVRVGDRTSVFDSEITRWIQTTASSLEKTPNFQWQRRLMGGGSCEGTAFQAWGHRTGALALPLDHYHNQGANLKIQPEAVSLQDWQSELTLLKALATFPESWKAPTQKLKAQLQPLQRKGMRALRKKTLKSPRDLGKL